MLGRATGTRVSHVLGSASFKRASRQAVPAAAASAAASSASASATAPAAPAAPRRTLVTSSDARLEAAALAQSLQGEVDIPEFPYIEDEQFVGKTGAEIFHDLMLLHGVEQIFGYPGGTF